MGAGSVPDAREAGEVMEGKTPAGETAGRDPRADTTVDIATSAASDEAADLQDLSDYLVGNYRWFHRHPELSYEEIGTTARIRMLLETNGIEVLDSGLRTGLVAIIRTDAPAPGGRRDNRDNRNNRNNRDGRDTHVDRPVIAIRGDIDALPLDERTGLAYSSENPGVMHACGHDVNLMVALGAAILLSSRSDELAGDVKVVFQPAEEVRADEEHPTGAVAVRRTGVLDDVRVFLGTHDTDELGVGQIGISSGAVSGAVDKFRIDITGHGTHAAHPDKGVNPVSVAAAIVTALQNLASQEVDPVHPHVLTVTHLEAGDTWNVVPSTAFLEGTVRTADVDDRDRIRQGILRVSELTAQAFGAHADVAWTPSSPSVINDSGLAAAAREVAETSGLLSVASPATLGGEDFSYYLRHDDEWTGAAGLFVHLGAASAEFPPHVIHSPFFAPDPRAIPSGARFLADLSIRVLHDLVGE
ncbi:MAG: amidohydrolase [Bifidobacterium minimum]|jgi:amidohydrolase|nr:amidohydrolase [Bifidobacterium minimum]